MTKTLSTKRSWSGKTGWCMTGYHAACPSAGTMLRPCTCECHEPGKQSAA